MNPQRFRQPPPQTYPVRSTRPQYNGWQTAPRPRYTQPQVPAPVNYDEYEPCGITKLPNHVFFTLETVISRHGSIDFSELQDQFDAFIEHSAHVNVRPELRSTLLKYPGLFQLQNQRPGSQTVRMSVQLDLCPMHASKSGCPGNCSGIHVCKFYIQGTECRFKNSCRFGHGLHDPHNLEILDRLSLSGLNIVQLRTIFGKTASLSARVPPICKFYNSGRVGCKHDARGGHGCPALHVCLHYVKGDCTFSFQNCKRSHNILNDQAKPLLQKFGVDVLRSAKEVLQDVRAALEDTDVPVGPGLTQPSARRAGSLGNLAASAGRFSLPQSQFASSNDLSALQGSLQSQFSRSKSRTTSISSQHSDDGDRNDEEQVICMFFLRKNCLFKNKCHNLHKALPYQWQFQVTLPGLAQEWHDLEERCNREIELNYCDPEKDNCMSMLDDSDTNSIFKVSFVNMTVEWSSQKQAAVRRLSTVSSVKADPTQAFTTHWKWFWKNDLGKWEQYGQGYVESTLDVNDLENTFLQDPEGSYCFATMSHIYKIDLKAMTQSNKETGNRRPIRRRPGLRIKNEDSGDSPLSDGATAASSRGTVPVHWDMDTDCRNSYKLVEIGRTGSTADEFQAVRDRFRETLPRTSARITKISRIQNLELWQGFSWKKTWMTQKNNNKPPTERLLFHGTCKEYQDAICQQGFDWRISGSSTGTKYGKGSYFARDAKYSSCYTDCATLFLVRVLVGCSTKGKSSHVRPPAKDKQTLYDSCVDDIKNPQIFVVFEHQQTYPEYLIEYQKTGKV